MVTRIGPKLPRRNFVSAWREMRGLTQEQLASRLDTHKGQVSNWENNKRAMSFDVQAALAEALDIDPSDLFRHPDQPSADAILRGQPPEIISQAISLIEVLLRKRG